MNELRLNRLVGVVGVLAMLLTALPLISGVSEPDTIMIKGFNLMEFSPLGCVPVLVPILIAVITFSGMNQSVKEAATILFAVGYLICYTQAFNAARAWLSIHADSFFTYYPGVVLMPLACILEMALWFFGRLYLKYRANRLVDDEMAYISFLVPKDWVD